MPPFNSTSSTTPVDPGSDLLVPLQLAGLRRELMDLQERKRAQLSALDDEGADELDEVFRAQARVARETLRSVEAALARLDAGTYGRCVRCSAAIPPARLEIMPHAQSCVPCSGRGGSS